MMKILHPDKDPLGNAVKDFYETGVASDILIESNIAEDDTIPSSYFFRTYTNMPYLEKLALSECTGKILDVGSTAGCHSLFLQDHGFDVTALEISDLCCEIMSKRGIIQVVACDLYSYSGNTFDTIIILMNGIGIAGRVKRLKHFFKQMHQILNPGGKIILDSSDIDYLYHEKDGRKLINLNSNYYGELIYRMQYKEIKGEPFEWLFIDYKTLACHARKNSFDASLLATGNHYDYLVVLKKI